MTDDAAPLEVRSAEAERVEGPGWTAEELLAAAVDSSLRFAFEGLARSVGVEVVSYAGSVLVRTAHADITDVVVRPRIVLARAADVELVRAILEEARRHTGVLRALGGWINIAPVIEVAAPARRQTANAG